MAWRESAAITKLRSDEIDVNTLKFGGDVLNGTAGTELTATAAEINAIDGLCTAAVFTVGDEAANVINVAIQLNDANAAAMAKAVGLKYYLSSDADGAVLEASGPDAIAIGTDGMLMKSGGDSLIHGHVVSESDGDIDIDITKAGADTFYLCLILPNGDITVSDAITFDATT